MFIGHAAVGLASKAAVPRASLGWLLAAPFLLDLLWPVFVLFGFESATIEHGATPFLAMTFDSYPWSHSLAMAIVWALLYGALAHLATGAGSVGIACALGVFSHWICDAIVHRPDLPLWPGSSVYVGMGLWNNVPATLAIEVPMFAAGVWLYTRATRAKDGVGRWAFVTMIALFLILYAGAAFGPPPPDMTTVAVSTLLLFALVLPLAIWIDQHREAEEEEEPSGGDESRASG